MPFIVRRPTINFGSHCIVICQNIFIIICQRSQIVIRYRNYWNVFNMVRHNHSNFFFHRHKGNVHFIAMHPQLPFTSSKVFCLPSFVMKITLLRLSYVRTLNWLKDWTLLNNLLWTLQMMLKSKWSCRSKIHILVDIIAKHYVNTKMITYKKKGGVVEVKYRLLVGHNHSYL